MIGNASQIALGLAWIYGTGTAGAWLGGGYLVSRGTGRAHRGLQKRAANYHAAVPASAERVMDKNEAALATMSMEMTLNVLDMVLTIKAPAKLGFEKALAPIEFPYLVPKEGVEVAGGVGRFGSGWTIKTIKSTETLNPKVAAEVEGAFKVGAGSNSGTKFVNGGRLIFVKATKSNVLPSGNAPKAIEAKTWQEYQAGVNKLTEEEDILYRSSIPGNRGWKSGERRG